MLGGVNSVGENTRLNSSILAELSPIEFALFISGMGIT
jgi:hypothetical protein